MFTRLQQSFWIKAFAVLGLLLMGWLLHHVQAGHPDGDHSDCPVCIAAAGLIVCAGLALLIHTLILLGLLRIEVPPFFSLIPVVRRGRSPPARLSLR